MISYNEMQFQRGIIIYDHSLRNILSHGCGTIGYSYLCLLHTVETHKMSRKRLEDTHDMRLKTMLEQTG